MPELVGDIKGAMHQLIEALGNWPTGKIDAIDAASTILAKINNMNDKLKQPEKDISRQIQDIYQKKAFFKRKTNVLHSLTKEDFRKSYTLLNQLITQVQDSLLDSDWK
ncbi:MAG: hypothetical protein KAR40_11950 [Candidatus Sabulitectum sp.]|nr:hypothetical protein [Candidatus Sabulitectum sp.]